MTNRTDPVGKQLETYEESWKTAHEQVKAELWQLEDSLAIGLALFKVIHDRYWYWRERVLSGTVEYNPDDERGHKARFSSWLRTCKSIMAHLVRSESKYGTVESGQQIRRCFHEARQILDTWTAPEQPSLERECSTESQDLPSHTDRVMDLDQLADGIERVSRPTPQANVPLKHKPDYSQVF
jgi:hypothetical protein